MALMKDQPCGSDDSSEDEMNMQRYMKGMVTMWDELFEGAKGKTDQARSDKSKILIKNMEGRR